jgi:hypothetical protein
VGADAGPQAARPLIWRCACACTLLRVAGDAAAVGEYRAAPMTNSRSNRGKREALEFHSKGRPGKIQVVPTKPLTTQRDLSLAYSPGVAEPCMEIFRDPAEVFKYTARGNLVAVITDGTAVLGLGDIGPLASKPVMEGQGGALQEVRRHRRVRHRDQLEELRPLHRDGRRAGADLRRDQPRGHQGAGVLLHRGGAQEADEHPGVPRRPARHGDHQRGRLAQRRGDPGQEAGGPQDRGQRRGSLGGRVHALLPEPRGQGGERADGRLEGGAQHAAQAGGGRPEARVAARDAGGHARRRDGRG